MHKLINNFRYKTKRLFSKYGEKTSNTVVKYNTEINLFKSSFKAFYRQRVYSKLMKADSNTYKTIYYMLGLSKNSKYTDITLKVIDYLATESVRIITKLTSTKSKVILESDLMTNNIELPNIILDIVRTVNCNYRIRPIVNSNSALYCKNIIINNDLTDEEKQGLEFIKVELINFNRLFNILELDSITKISDFEELFYSNDFDFSFYTSKISKNNNIDIILGDNNNDQDTIMALLLKNRIYDAENLEQNSDIYTIDMNDANEILRTGNVSFRDFQNYEEVKEEFVRVEVGSKISNFGNTIIERKVIENNITGIESKMIESGGNAEIKDEKVGD